MSLPGGSSFMQGPGALSGTAQPTNNGSVNGFLPSFFPQGSFNSGDAMQAPSSGTQGGPPSSWLQPFGGSFAPMPVRPGNLGSEGLPAPGSQQGGQLPGAAMQTTGGVLNPQGSSVTNNWAQQNLTPQQMAAIGSQNNNSIQPGVYSGASQSSPKPNPSNPQQASRENPGFAAWSPGSEMVNASSRLQTESPGPKESKQTPG